MIETASLDDLLKSGAHISPHEAVAIVQQLLTTRDADPETNAVAPEDVMLFADGEVRSRTGPLSVDAVGRLLEIMLPSGNGHRVPGALRFTIARACSSVDAPPFESRAALSAALERFESGAREAVVCQLLLRAALLPAAPIPAVPPRPERRLHASVSDLRRELRKSDERVFELLQASTPTLAVTQPQLLLQPAPAAPSRARWAAVAIASVLGSFAAGYAATELMEGSTASQPAAAQTSVERTP